MGGEKGQMVRKMLRRLLNVGSADYENTGPQEAKDLVDSDEYTVVDVRSKKEHMSRAIPGTDHLLPLKQLPQRMDEIEGDNVLIYCKSGNRSASASRHLTQNGDFDEVHNLKGGIIAWSRNGLPIK